jgi:type VI secretion system secreted protein Hcp
MPETKHQAGRPAEGGASDIYLHVQTKRAGKVKGEATATGHADDIIVRSWKWGVTAASALGSTQATGRRAYKHLTVVKGIDSATTALLSALVSNDEVKEAKLTLRRSGDGQQGYFTVTLKSARVVALDHATDEAGATQETVALAFMEVEVEYRVQQASGGRGGSFTFNDQVLAV